MYVAGLTIALGVVALQGQTTTYTIYSPEGRRNLSVRGGSPETFALEQLVGPFGLTFTEDRLAGGLVIGIRNSRIIAVPGQSFIQVAGRVVGLDAPIRRERNSWIVSIDFLTKALGPALGEPIVLRRSSRLILVGNVRVPQVGGRVERTASGARIVLNVQPATPHTVTRDGNRLTVRFEATALDPSPLTGFIADFATAARVDGTTLVIDLGPQAATFRVDANRGQETTTIDLLPPAPVTPPPQTAAPAAPPTAPLPPVDLAPALRTIVIDPGHGGEDAGVRGKDAAEKDVTLQIARRLRAAIESRMGLRVLLTRDADDTVPIDRRTAFANHNKADLFLSLHANASIRAVSRGAQVYSLDAADYPHPESPADVKRRTVPLLGGGTRIIDPMPWDLAQLPFAEHSAAFALIVLQQFTDRGVALHTRPGGPAPLRALAGANMPAVLIELGFLTNADDEKLLSGADSQLAWVDAIVAAIAEVRRGFSSTDGRHQP